MTEIFNAIRVVVAAASASSRKWLYPDYTASVLSCQLLESVGASNSMKIIFKIFYAVILSCDLGFTSGTLTAVVGSLSLFLCQILLDFPWKAVSHQGAIFLLHVFLWILRDSTENVREVLAVEPPEQPSSAIYRFMTPVRKRRSSSSSTAARQNLYTLQNFHAGAHPPLDHLAAHGIFGQIVQAGMPDPPRIDAPAGGQVHQNANLADELPQAPQNLGPQPAQAQNNTPVAATGQI